MQRVNTGSVSRAVITLVAGSVFAAWMSEILVGAAEGTGSPWACPETFIGINLFSPS